MQNSVTSAQRAQHCGDRAPMAPCGSLPCAGRAASGTWGWTQRCEKGPSAGLCSGQVPSLLVFPSCGLPSMCSCAREAPAGAWFWVTGVSSSDGRVLLDDIKGRLQLLNNKSCGSRLKEKWKSS